VCQKHRSIRETILDGFAGAAPRIHLTLIVPEELRRDEVEPFAGFAFPRLGRLQECQK
jgi:hypothetical protein